MMIVEATRPGALWHVAYLTEEDDGIRVVVRQRLAGECNLWKNIHTDVIDAPMHVVCDRVLDMLNELDPPGLPPSMRRK